MQPYLAGSGALLPLQREFLHGVEVREVLILVVQQQCRHIGAVVLRRHLDKLRNLCQGELGQECGDAGIVLSDTVVDCHPIQIGDDVVCLPGKLAYREALDFKAVIRRNLMPQPVDPIYVGMSVIERDVDFIVEIFVLHVDAMLFLLHHTKA